jgi:hypothetical protein
MALTTVSRPSLTDDTGDGESGDVVNAAYFGTKIYDVIDALFSAAAGIACNGPVYERGRTAAIGEWIAFTPTVTGLTLGNGTIATKYARVGKTVLMEGTITLGSTSSIAGSANISLPVSNTGIVSGQPVGHAVYIDVSTGSRYGGIVSVNSSTVVGFWTFAAPFGQVATAVPFTWATGDVIVFQLCWQEP